ncbi:hypothetical protein GCM10022202_23490 [Microbacterium marinilacus]|uniref:Transposase n=1 Tax=Microbacterium marinilacus TaxID=415209 RepID=A0ABP7BI39_9MICO
MQVSEFERRELGQQEFLAVRAVRHHSRSRGIVTVVSEPADRQGNLLRRGSRGGRPVGYGHADYKGRNLVERGFSETKQ